MLIPNTDARFTFALFGYLKKHQMRPVCISVFIILQTASYSHAQPAKGANKFLGNITTSGQIRTDFTDYWNQITGENESKWGAVEAIRDSMCWEGTDRIAEFARENNIPWKFRSLITGGTYPNWVSSLPAADLLDEIGEWMDAAAERYPDVQMIDVVTEVHPNHRPPIPIKDALGGAGATGFDWVIKAFTMAREWWSEAILICNDYNNIEFDNELNWTLDMVTACKNAGAPIDAIGCEAHYACTLPVDSVKNNIDRLAATGLPLFITEYDIDESDDAVQDSIMREQFTMFWKHPKIVGITYWGYVVGRTWRTGTGLLSDDGIERPALTWLVDFVKNNPDPPNDFPELFNPEMEIITISKGYRGITDRYSVMHHKRKMQPLFDLQGRSAGILHGTGRRNSASSIMASPGVYLVKPVGLPNSPASESYFLGRWLSVKQSVSY